ncbi:MAG TPA: ABC transporter permease [Puia sp.]|jgi:putative ABC transport system permease protein
MLRNYFRTAWRNLVNNKLYSVLNIGGLSVGICVCMLILVYVMHERSFDKFHRDAERIFYPVLKLKIGEADVNLSRLSYESAPVLMANDPGIEGFLRMQEISSGKAIGSLGPGTEKKFTEKKIFFADSNFFSFFSFRLVEGNVRSVLSRPFTMVISQRAAHKYFGDEDPVGKLLKYDGGYTFEITGVAENPPSNSSIDYDFLGSAVSVRSMSRQGAAPSSGEVEIGDFTSFLLLRDPKLAAASARIAQTLPRDQKFKHFRFYLNSLAQRQSEHETAANAKYRKIFPLVAVLILLLALINYMSLATARSTIRSKEIGVRKVLGADRGKIVKQFYIESGLYAVIAFVLAMGLFVLVRPSFYTLLQLRIDESFFSGYYTLGVGAALLVVTIFISGSYPSLVLSAFNPVKVLYGRLGRQKASVFVRKALTVVQFTISVALIIASLVINRQLYFFRHMDTGIDREQVLMVPYQKTTSRHYQAFRAGVGNIPGVVGVATAAAPVYGGIDMSRAKTRDAKQSLTIAEMYVDETFVKLLGLHWKIAPATEGKGQVVINEEAADKLNLPADPMGQQIVVGRDTVKVCGVIKNFNYRSLHETIMPLCMFVANGTDSSWYKDNGDCLFVKIGRHTNIPTLLESVRAVHDGIDKTAPFEYLFLDEAFDAQYKAEDRLARIFNVFTVITIFIACLGLFGLASFSAAQRTKEIGIRKVLGADTMGIVRLISGSFIKPVLVSIVIAMPLAWMLMEGWLRDFPYRVDIGGWVFVVAGLGTLVVAGVTVSVQALRSAVANPVGSLRVE